MFFSSKNTQATAYALFLLCLSARGQRFLERFDTQGRAGFVNGSLNFQQSFSSGFNLGMSLDLVSVKNSSLSLGADMRFGCENRYGLGYVYILALLYTGSNMDTQNNPDFGAYAEFPLTLHYNFGYGSSRKATGKFGFYLGGGLGYLLTSYVYGNNYVAPASFWGWTAEAGVRFNNYELGVYKAVSMGGPVAGIPQPAYYGLSLNAFIFKPKNQARRW